MSLPTMMLFKENGETVAQLECNIGWSFSVEDLPKFIVDSVDNWNPTIEQAMRDGKPELADRLINWLDLIIDEIVVYNYTVPFDDMMLWYHKELDDEQIIERFKKVS